MISHIVVIVSVAVVCGGAVYILVRSASVPLSVVESQVEWELNPRVVKDAVPETGLDSPSLSERKARAERRERVELARAREMSGEDGGGGSTEAIESVDSEFRWQTGTDIDFSDIGGMDSLKQELRQDVLLPLKESPKRAEELGVVAPNIVFYGPPGTGKTYLVKALATELGLPFARLSGSSVQSKWINESTDKVATLFEEAKEVAAEAGGAVVFIDELDSVLKERTAGTNTHEEDRKVVNEFLTHLEETNDHNIVFLGATNRVDALDEAGVRSGRIDKKVHVGKPNEEARFEILHAQLEHRPHSVSDRSVRAVAKNTEGATAADLELLMREAAKRALMNGRDEVVDADLQHYSS